MSRLLSDRSTYLPLKGNPTASYKKELVLLVEEGLRKRVISKNEKAFLIPVAPRVPVIYYLPKVHKDPVCPPGRPIVSGIDSVTSRVGKYIDHFCNLWLLRPPLT